MVAGWIRKVLVPTDFSEVADNALHTAISICTRQQAELVLVHVIEQNYFLLSPEAGAIPIEGMTSRDQEADEMLSNLAEPMRDRFDIRVSTVVLAGDPAGEICRWSASNSIDMIVMGTHGASGLREFFIGSNAYRVVKHAACPVMTIPGSNRWIEFRRILFPVRLVPDALAKYDVIRPVIRRNGSTLLIAGVVKRGDEAAASAMEDLVKVVEKKMADDDVNYRSEVHYAEDVARHVLYLSEAEKPDLVVITATFESDDAVRSFFIGPYTQQIVNHCKFPVLSIRGEQDEVAGGETGTLRLA